MAKILIVDDRAANRDYLVTLLRYQGYTLFEAEDGSEALTLLKDTLVDLIITDVLMPGMDGYTLVKLLKQNAITACIPVIFIPSPTWSMRLKLSPSSAVSIIFCKNPVNLKKYCQR